MASEIASLRGSFFIVFWIIFNYREGIVLGEDFLYYRVLSYLSQRALLSSAETPSTDLTVWVIAGMVELIIVYYLFEILIKKIIFAGTF